MRDGLRAIAGRPQRHRPAFVSGELQGGAGSGGGAFERGGGLGSAARGQQQLSVCEHRPGVVAPGGARRERFEQPVQRCLGRRMRQAGRERSFGGVGLQLARDLIDQRLAALALDRPVGPRGRRQHRHHEERRPAQGRDAHQLRIAEKKRPSSPHHCETEGRPR